MFSRTVLLIGVSGAAIGIACASRKLLDTTQPPVAPSGLTVHHDAQAGTISVFRAGGTAPILTETAKADSRPFLHPIVAPGGTGVVTDGISWGFTHLNDRDFFHNTGADYWRRVSVSVLKADSPGDARWETVYDLLDASGNPLMTETARWTLHDDGTRYLLDLTW